MNRCIGFTKTNKKCRAIIKNNDNTLFCCESHEPLNKDEVYNRCFMCIEKINCKNNFIYFKCRHIFHKSCYLEWLNFSNYSEPICLICRKSVFKKNEKKVKNKITLNTSKLDKINYILFINYYNNNINIKLIEYYKINNTTSNYITTGYTESGYTESGYTGSGYTGSGYTGSSYTGSGYTGSGYTASGYTASGYTTYSYDNEIKDQKQDEIID